MIKITAKHTVKENCIDELIIVLKELVEKSRLEEGCISYSLYKDIDNDNILGYRRYRREESSPMV